MRDVIVFAGTSEGRQLYGFCADKGIDALFLQEKPCLVIDATHPYAAKATEQIRVAAEHYRKGQNIDGRVYCRVLRQLQETEVSDASAFTDMAQAVAYLNSTEGNILVTTGSKEIDKLCKLNGYEKRAYVRILPNPDILKQYLDRGFPAGHMICMQGPFTEEMNRAVMGQYNIRYLLTKQSGAAGGYPEKCRAAQAAGVDIVSAGPECADMKYVVIDLEIDYGYIEV